MQPSGSAELCRRGGRVGWITRDPHLDPFKPDYMNLMIRNKCLINPGTSLTRTHFMIIVSIYSTKNNGSQALIIHSCWWYGACHPSSLRRCRGKKYKLFGKLRIICVAQVRRLAPSHMLAETLPPKQALGPLEDSVSSRKCHVALINLPKILFRSVLLLGAWVSLTPSSPSVLTCKTEVKIHLC